jgi:uncharacterized protein
VRYTPAVLAEPPRFDDVHLTLCLTHDCNLACRYCYGGTKSRRHMTRATAHRALELALARTSARLHLVFFGGEPLLRWRALTTLADEARSRAAACGVELRPTVTTNGTLLTPERATWLRTQGFVVAISCDGVRAAHDAHRTGRGGRSSHARTAAGLRLALEAGLAVRTILVLDPATVDLLPDSLAWLRSLGAADFVVNPNWLADWTAPPLRERWERSYAAAAALWVAAFREDRPFWLSFLDDKVSTHLKGGYTPSERCDLGRRNLVVAPSGRLYPCDRLVGEDRDERFVLGDVASGPVPERVASLVQRTCAMPADCLECAVAPRCRNRCACANLALTGAIETPSETLCFAEQLAIRTADAAAATLFAEHNAAFLRRHYPEASR